MIAIVMSVLADYVFADIFHVMLRKGFLGFDGFGASFIPAKKKKRGIRI